MKLSINYLGLIALISNFGIIILNNFHTDNTSEIGVISIMLTVIELVVLVFLIQIFRGVRIEHDKLFMDRLIGKTVEIKLSDILGFKINYTGSKLVKNRELEIRTREGKSFSLNYLGTKRFEELENYFLEKFKLLKDGYIPVEQLDKDEYLRIKPLLDRGITKKAKCFNFLIIIILALVVVGGLDNVKSDIYEQIRIALGVTGGSCLIILLFN